jgi:hypothetical protein
VIATGAEHPEYTYPADSLRGYEILNASVGVTLIDQNRGVKIT